MTRGSPLGYMFPLPFVLQNMKCVNQQLVGMCFGLSSLDILLAALYLPFIWRGIAMLKKESLGRKMRNEIIPWKETVCSVLSRCGENVRRASDSSAFCWYVAPLRGHLHRNVERKQVQWSYRGETLYCVDQGDQGSCACGVRGPVCSVTVEKICVSPIGNDGMLPIMDWEDSDAHMSHTWVGRCSQIQSSVALSLCEKVMKSCAFQFQS